MFGWIITTVIGIVGATSLAFGFEAVLTLAIDIAAKLEPNSKHPDIFEAYKKRVWRISSLLSIGLTAVAIVAGEFAYGL